MNGITFDAGSLIALDRNDRRVIALIARITERGFRITIPATALAQAIRNPAKQVRLSRLDGPNATAGGMLLARTGTVDIVDAHVALCAQRTGHAVVTSDADDLRRIAPRFPDGNVDARRVYRATPVSTPPSLCARFRSLASLARF